MADDGTQAAGDADANPDSVLSYALVWLALLALLGLTMLAAHLLTGVVGLVIGLVIASTKAALVVWFFLHLRHHHGLTRVAAVFALLWLLLLLAFPLIDVLTRVPV